MLSEARRPRALVVVAGTATEVGKTWVAARLAAAARSEGLHVGARKPVQSYAPDDPGPTDAEQLAAASAEPPETVCPRARSYPLPMAPPMAAAALGRPPILLADLVRETAASWPRATLDLGLVELAGGPRSPLADDGDGVDLVRQLAPDLVLLVADAGLGTINAVRLAADVFAPTPLWVQLNRFDAGEALHRRNRDWLAERAGLTVHCDIAALGRALVAWLPAFCRHCGRPRARCADVCARPLDPPHFCPRCGSKLVVQVAPTGFHARCRAHGALPDGPPT